jgi:hypothetical protein
MYVWFSIFVLVLSLSSGAYAQGVVTSASLGGRISDSTGAALPGVSVTVTQTERSQTWQAVSDARGLYRFPFLPVGAYRIVAELNGFATVTRDFNLAVGDAIDYPLTMAPEGHSEHVSIVAEAARVDLVRSHVAERVTPGEIAQLPLNGRNYLDLALLAPGVSRTNTRNTERLAETSAVPGTGLSVMGQRNTGNTFVIDGLSANDDAADLAGTYFSQEVIREFQVITSAASAEFGRSSAGAFNIVTQSGTNQTRGAAYAYFRDARLDARNAFATARDPLSQQQIGASIGGPLRSDRTFYFVNVESTRNDRTGYVSISPANLQAVNSRLDATGYRGPRVATGAFRTGYDTSNLFARLDRQQSPGHLLTARYSFYDMSSPNARSVGALNDSSRGTALENRDQNLAVTSVMTRSSGLLNELRAQMWRSRLQAPPNDAVGPAVTISGVANLGVSTSSPSARDLDFVQMNDTVTVQHGNHLLKAGGDFVYNALAIAFPGALAGSYSFASLANFERGQYSQFQQAFGEPVQSQSNPNATLFVQDEWRARDRLTINVGMRYDVQGLDDPIRTDWNNLAPRVGFVWAASDRQTLVRGGVGRYFDRVPLRAVSNALQRDGLKYKVAVLSFGQIGAPVFPNTLPVFPANVVTAISSMQSDIDNAESWQGNVQLERTVGRSGAITVAYQSLRGARIIMQRNINVPTLTAAQAAAAGIANLGRPDPRFANINQYASLGKSRFDGLTVSAKAGLSTWGHARVSYTFGKALDDAGNAFFSAPQDNFNVHDDWGPSDNDQQHRLVFSGSIGSSAKGLQLAWLYTYGSPQPFNIVTGGDRNNDTTVNDRPAGIGRNTGVGFNAAALDVSAGYRFRLGRTTLDLRLDAFNLTNRVNLLFPNNTFGQGNSPLPAFGVPTAAGDPRQLQIGLRAGF